ncbi:sodium-independent sulfate anion transporter-like isoform X2 [Maniola hyperantus]|uniref:sodium-independent sulfate anion transporter-like isoform X1 n=1 Tax=Aphantopus hyperantus TaxID=2795564 RepID=UPI00156A15E1|nr:sodium-independent sulfate anion transporter-like isoform X2 [Maniola hyperantus]
MTKYKLNNAVRSSSEVTLTSYMTGSTDSERKDECYQIPGSNDTEQDDVSESNNVEDGKCHVCPNSCEFLQEPGKIAASLEKRYDKYSLNELKVENLGRGCLCEKYNGGCKLCPRPSLAPTLTLSMDGTHGKGACLACNGGACGTPNPLSNGGYPPYPSTSKKSKWKSDAARRLRACCSKKTLLRRIPILAWLPNYSFRSGLADIIAGITVGLTVIPQAIAYAGVAGLPPQYGLYSSFMACFVYTVFGSVKDSAIGPTAIAAILTRENLHGLGPEFAVLLSFLSGCVELIMGILQLGFLIDFISGPVSVGFTSAAAIIIATTQVKDILGLSFPGGKFLQVWTGMYEHIGETRLWDTVLGVSCIVVLLLLRKVKDIKIGSDSEDKEGNPEKRSQLKAALAQTLWFLSTTRNIFVVLVCAGLAYYYDTKNQQPFVLTGNVKAGLPQFAPPPFSATVGNHTYTFTEMASTLGSAIFVVPLLSILENIALAKVFSEGKYVDATQEMVALGVCNIASSFVESMPVSGALSRGAVNHASGVASPAGGLYTGALVLLALQYFTPYFYYIPKASLAAVIIAAVVFMMELHVFKPIWRTKKVDIIPAVVTFTACLVTRLELGIVLGIAVNLLFLLYASARPAVKVTTAVSEGGVRYAVASVDRALAFPAAEFVRRALRKAAGDAPLVLDAHHVQAADFTAAKGIKSLIEDFHARGQTIIFYNVKPSIAEVFKGVKPREFVHCSCRMELERLLLEAQSKSKQQVA